MSIVSQFQANHSRNNSILCIYNDAYDYYCALYLYKYMLNYATQTQLTVITTSVHVYHIIKVILIYKYNVCVV